MAATFTGNATLQGFGGTIAWSGATFASGLDVASWTLTRNQPVVKRRNSQMKTTGMTLDPETVWQLDLEIVLKMSSGQLAQDSVLLPGPLTVVTCAAFPAPTGDTDLINCAQWRVMDGAKFVGASEEEAKYSLSLEQITGTDVATAAALTTVVS